MYERLDTLISIGDTLGLRRREKIKFIRHEKNTFFLCTVQYQIVNDVNGIIHRPISLCWFLVRSTGEKDSLSRAELLPCIEHYKNGCYFFCVIPIEIKEKI